MSDITVKDATLVSQHVDTFTRTEGANTVHMQAVVPVDPDTGAPNAATEVTLLALKAATEALLQAASAIRDNADNAALIATLKALVHPIWADAYSGRLRVVLDPAGGAQTLGTVTSVTSLVQFSGLYTNSFIYDQMHSAWADTVRRAVA